MNSVFISYSHKDEDLRKELEVHLAGLQRLGLISVWHDRRIAPGADFKSEIDVYLNSADIVLLLVSPDFIASDYCFDVELQTALDRHERGECKVLPVILRPCDWKALPFGELLATPTDGVPVTKFQTLDDGFLEVVNSLKRCISEVGSVAPGGTRKKVPTAPGKISEHIRSSNLRVKKAFTDQEIDEFRTEAFEYISRFFENSLTELESRNSGTTSSFHRVNASRFEAKIYQNGQEVSSCTVGSRDGAMFGSGITFSYGTQGNGVNESLSISDDGYQLLLQPLMGFRSTPTSKEGLTMAGASELFWGMFLDRLQ